MLSIQESINKINEEKNQTDTKLKETQDKGKELELMLEFFAMSFSELIRQIASLKYDVNVKFPNIQKIDGDVSVSGFTSLLHAINELSVLTKRNKLELPDTQEVRGEVKVQNFPEPIKIPEYPKEIKAQVTSLPKYLADKIDLLTATIKKLDVSPVINVENEAPQVQIDLESIKSGLEDVVKAIRLIQTAPEVNIDLKSVIDACDKTTKAINSLVFPVPSFHSSYDHSLTMRSEDLDKSYVWTTDGGKDVVESITVRDEDGSLWIRTYSYDGSGKVAHETKWTRV